MRMEGGCCVVQYEPQGLDGLGAIKVSFGNVYTFRFSLTDAESIGEAMVEVVRQAEKQTKVECWRGKK